MKNLGTQITRWVMGMGSAIWEELKPRLEWEYGDLLPQEAFAIAYFPQDIRVRTHNDTCIHP